MHPVLPLAALGRRIMVTGPTNSGKSTLADAIGRKIGIPAVHVDRFSHLPNTDWMPRPVAEFHALHDAAILADSCGLEGGRDSVSWEMIGWIWKSRDASKYGRMAAASGLPVLTCRSLRELEGLFKYCGLERRR